MIRNDAPTTQKSIADLQAQITALVTVVTNLTKQRTTPAIRRWCTDNDYNDNGVEEEDDKFFTCHFYSPIYDRYDTDDDDDVDKEEHTSEDIFTNWNGDPIYNEFDDENIELAETEFAPNFWILLLKSTRSKISKKS